MNRQYLEYIPEIGTPAANSHHGQQQPLHQQPGCKAANPSNHHDVNACSPWADHVGDSDRLNEVPLTYNEIQQVMEPITALRTPLKLNGFINGKTVVAITRDTPADTRHFGQEVSLKA